MIRFSLPSSLHIFRSRLHTCLISSPLIHSFHINIYMIFLFVPLSLHICILFTSLPFFLSPQSPQFPSSSFHFFRSHLSSYSLFLPFIHFSHKTSGYPFYSLRLLVSIFHLLPHLFSHSPASAPRTRFPLSSFHLLRSRFSLNFFLLFLNLLCHRNSEALSEAVQSSFRISILRTRAMSTAHTLDWMIWNIYRHCARLLLMYSLL